jgi:DNA-binding MarR family transcriptional regulator
MTTQDSKLAWNYITLLNNFKDENKLHVLSGVEFQVLAFIGCYPNHSTISKIENHPAFKFFSSSDIIRSIVSLTALKLIGRGKDLLGHATYTSNI